jgi:hypothetical protein
MIEWYQSFVNCRNASLVRRVLSLVLFQVFEKIFYFNLSSLLLIYKYDFNDYLLLVSLSFSR